MMSCRMNRMDVCQSTIASSILGSCTNMQKYAKNAKNAKKVMKYAIKHADNYAIKYVEYATTNTDMQNMWITKYAKYVAYAEYVN